MITVANFHVHKIQVSEYEGVEGVVCGLKGYSFYWQMNVIKK
jgi:hypothetical protein